MVVETSVVIRTKNEEKYLQVLLDILKSQSYNNYEIIIVDDNSTDKTLDIAGKNNCKVITIPKGKFSHPYSCNLGAEVANGKYVVFLNGHSLPITNTWLGDGLKNFNDNLVAGVYAVTLAHKDGTFADKLLYNIVGYTIGLLKYRGGKHSLSLLGTTNAIIRKDLWLKVKFNENVNSGWGGEDSVWAREYIKLGYQIVHEPRFRVRHSHHLAMKDIFWRLRNWIRMFVQSSEDPEKQRRNY